MTTLKDKVKQVGSSIASAATQVGDKAGKVAKTTVATLSDINGDGKVDTEDLKIAIEKAKKIGGTVAEETGRLARDVTKNPIVQNAAAGAVIGSVVIPGVGAVLGAKLGAVAGVLIGGAGDTAVKTVAALAKTTQGVGKSSRNKTTARKPSGVKKPESAVRKVAVKNKAAKH